MDVRWTIYMPSELTQQLADRTIAWNGVWDRHDALEPELFVIRVRDVRSADSSGHDSSGQAFRFFRNLRSAHSLRHCLWI